MPNPMSGRLATIALMAAASVGLGVTFAGMEPAIDLDRDPYNPDGTLSPEERQREKERRYAEMYGPGTRSGRTVEYVLRDTPELDTRPRRIRDRMGFYRDAPPPRKVVTHIDTPKILSKRAKRRAKGRAK